MGRASHKLAGSYISMNTVVPVDELLDLCELVAKEGGAGALYAKSAGFCRVQSRGPAGIRFVVLNLMKKPIMSFDVQAEANEEDGGTDLVTEIVQFRTVQNQLLGVVPAGPKRLVAWPAYQTFMRDLEDAVLEFDPDAEIEIIEEWA